MLCGLLCQCTSGPIDKYSNLKKWEKIEFKKLGITIDVPKSAYDRSQWVSQPVSHWGQCLGAGFSLHSFSYGGYFSEFRPVIRVYFYLFSKEMWDKYLEGPYFLGGQVPYGTTTNRFVPVYNGYRKDYRASDGRVLSACSQWNSYRTGEGGAEDKAAVKRIIESVRFTNP